MKLYIVGLAILFVSSWAPADAQQPEAGVHEISYCDLAKNPQSFSGKRIRVRAIYKYGFEIQRLDPPSCCTENRVKIWVEIEPHLQGESLKLFRRFPKGMGIALATFVGTFESGGPYGDGGYRFKLTVDRIEKLEGAEKASPSHIPTWVPQNCETSDAAPNNQSAPTGLHEMLHGDGTDRISRTRLGAYPYDATTRTRVSSMRPDA